MNVYCTHSLVFFSFRIGVLFLLFLCKVILTEATGGARFDDETDGSTEHEIAVVKIVNDQELKGKFIGVGENSLFFLFLLFFLFSCISLWGVLLSLNWIRCH